MSDDLTECCDCDLYWIGGDGVELALDHTRDTHHRVTVHTTI